MSEELTQPNIAELNRLLAYIGNASTGVCKKATAAGAKLLAKKMADASPRATKYRRVRGRTVQPGGMSRSIGSRSVRGPVAQAKAGFDVGKKNRTDATGSHGHLFVEGTADRWTGFSRIRVKGKTVDLKRTKNQIMYRGKSPAHLPSFIRGVTESSADTVRSIFISTVESEIKKVIDKQGL